jgi:NgoPII restriction endonuclease
MSTNILKALLNIANNPVYKIQTLYKNKNRANSMGDALELYIQDSLAGTFNESNLEKINQAYSDCFSYLGNTSNPPDLIIKEGDAFEIKKSEKLKSAIALNSSHPKNKLYSSDTRITKACRNCENETGGWSEKDIVYVVGNIVNENLKNLWFVYGDCYSASKETYEKIALAIKNGLHELPDIEFTKTKELAKINKVDPLGITYLRVRGMWGIENPINVYSYLIQANISNTFNLIALIPEEKYNSFPLSDREKVESSQLQIESKKIKDPNNPANLINVKLITYEFKN